MRTTLDIPESLINKVKKLTGFKSKTDVIIYSLNEVLKKQKIEELKSLAGKLNISVDLNKSRRRNIT